MSERAFYRVLVFSTVFHLVFLALISISVKKARQPINPFLSSYSVNLVDDIAGRSKGPESQSLPGRLAERLPQTEKQKSATKKAKPSVQAKAPQEPVRSLVPKRLPAKETMGTTKDELRRLDERIKEMKRRTASSAPLTDVRRGPPAVGGNEGSSGRVGAYGSEQDTALARYLVGMRDRIESAWHIPFVSGAKKHLEARVTVKIRKDGRIIDISVDKRSGNRAYDESVLRVLRAVDPLPPLPPSVEDPLEVEMTLRPEGIS